MNFIIKANVLAPFLAILFVLFGCSDNINDSESSSSGLLTGFNINWSFLPELNDDIVAATVALHPKIIRYPGGTVSKTWQWEEGVTTKNLNRTAHPLTDLLRLKKATDSKVIFVLNTINSSLENQLDLLRTAQNIGIDIEYIEIGNEHYLGEGGNVDDSGKHQDNVRAFPTGKEYAEFINNWSETILEEFPDVKIGISMFGRSSNKERTSNWNRLIIENIDKNTFHAYVYHIYVNVNDEIELDEENLRSIIKTRTDKLEAAMVDDDSKEKWVTEYGVHAQSVEATVELSKLLADYVDSIAILSMPQVLYSKSTAKPVSATFLTPPDADSLTELGTMFSDRAKNN